MRQFDEMGKMDQINIFRFEFVDSNSKIKVRRFEFENRNSKILVCVRNLRLKFSLTSFECVRGKTGYLHTALCEQTRTCYAAVQ